MPAPCNSVKPTRTSDAYTTPLSSPTSACMSVTDDGAPLVMVASMSRQAAGPRPHTIQNDVPYVDRPILSYAEIQAIAGEFG